MPPDAEDPPAVNANAVGEAHTDLNPNVPEFYPQTAAPASGQESDDKTKAKEKAAKAPSKAQPKAGGSKPSGKDQTPSEWVQVKRKTKEERRSGSKRTSMSQDEREELDFNFDEEMDIPAGRQNRFSK